MELQTVLLSQLERDVMANRRVLERVPEGRNEWKPYPRSMTMGRLAALVASMPGWVAFMVERDELNFDDPASAEFRTRTVETRSELLQLLEDNAARGRRALEATDAQHLAQRWRFVSGGRVLMEEPRSVMIADSVFSHLAHHRRELTVYLRLNEAAASAIHAPGADAGMLPAA